MRGVYLFVCEDCDRQNLVSLSDPYVLNSVFCVGCSNLMKPIGMPKNYDYITRMTEEKHNDRGYLPEAYQPRALLGEMQRKDREALEKKREEMEPLDP